VNQDEREAKTQKALDAVLKVANWLEREAEVQPPHRAVGLRKRSVRLLGALYALEECGVGAAKSGE